MTTSPPKWMPVNPAGAARLDVADPKSVRAAALRLLARREHSERELAGKLRLRGCDGAVVDAVMSELIAARALSDGRFAEAYAHSRVQRGYGPLRIRAELQRRGVADATVAETLRQLEPSWQQILHNAQQRRFGPLSTAIDSINSKERQRQTRVLNQRGFTLEQINQLFDDCQ